MTNFFYFVNRDSSIAIRHSLLNILFHLPNTTGADAGAETAADTEFLVYHIFIRAVFKFFPADSAIITGSFTHVAVPADSTGHAAVGLFLYLEYRLAPADIIVGCFYLFIADHRFQRGPVV